MSAVNAFIATISVDPMLSEQRRGFAAASRCGAKQKAN